MLAAAIMRLDQVKWSCSGFRLPGIIANRLSAHSSTFVLSHRTTHIVEYSMYAFCPDWPGFVHLW